jgi:hypothetical protein
MYRELLAGEFRGIVPRASACGLGGMYRELQLADLEGLYRELQLAEFEELYRELQLADWEECTASFSLRIGRNVPRASACGFGGIANL